MGAPARIGVTCAVPSTAATLLPRCAMLHDGTGRQGKPDRCANRGRSVATRAVPIAHPRPRLSSGSGRAARTAKPVRLVLRVAACAVRQRVRRRNVLRSKWTFPSSACSSIVREHRHRPPRGALSMACDALRPLDFIPNFIEVARKALGRSTSRDHGSGLVDTVVWFDGVQVRHRLRSRTTLRDAADALGDSRGCGYRRARARTQRVAYSHGQVSHEIHLFHPLVMHSVTDAPECRSMPASLSIALSLYLILAAILSPLRALPFP